MKYILYATIRKQLGKVEEYKLINKDTLEKISLDEDSTIELIMNNEVENLDLDGLNIIANDGCLDDYAVINQTTGEIVFDNRYTIINKKNNKFILCSGTDKVLEISEDKLVNYIDSVSNRLKLLPCSKELDTSYEKRKVRIELKDGSIIKIEPSKIGEKADIEYNKTKTSLEYKNIVFFVDKISQESLVYKPILIDDNSYIILEESGYAMCKEVYKRVIDKKDVIYITDNIMDASSFLEYTLKKEPIKYSNKIIMIYKEQNKLNALMKLNCRIVIEEINTQSISITDFASRNDILDNINKFKELDMLLGLRIYNNTTMKPIELSRLCYTDIMFNGIKYLKEFRQLRNMNLTYIDYTKFPTKISEKRGVYYKLPIFTYKGVGNSEIICLVDNSLTNLTLKLVKNHLIIKGDKPVDSYLTASIKVLAAELVCKDKNILLERKVSFYNKDIMNYVLKYEITDEVIKIWIFRYYVEVYTKDVYKYIKSNKIEKDKANKLNMRLSMIGEDSYEVNDNGDLEIKAGLREIDRIDIPEFCDSLKINNGLKVKLLNINSHKFRLKTTSKCNTLEVEQVNINTERQAKQIIKGLMIDNIFVNSINIKTETLNKGDIIAMLKNDNVDDIKQLNIKGLDKESAKEIIKRGIDSKYKSVSALVRTNLSKNKVEYVDGKYNLTLGVNLVMLTFKLKDSNGVILDTITDKIHINDWLNKYIHAANLVLNNLVEEDANSIRDELDSIFGIERQIENLTKKANELAHKVYNISFEDNIETVKEMKVDGYSDEVAVFAIRKENGEIEIRTNILIDHKIS